MKSAVVLGGILVCVLVAPAFADPVEPLIINDTFDKCTCLVYDLPADADRAEAIAFIEGFRDRFFPGLEVIDAGAVDEKTLAGKLTGSYVLFSVLGQDRPLLTTARSGLPVEIADGRFRLQNNSVTLAETRFIFIGKSPYSEAPVVVYAAGSNELINNINRVFHGPASWHLFRGTEPVAEGDYGKDFELPPVTLTLDEAVDDVRQFFASLERVHPDLLANLASGDYPQLKAWAVNELGRRLDGEQRLTLKDLANILYFAAARFHDGHTSVHWRQALNAENAPGRMFPPFILDFENGRFIMTTARDEDLAGGELVAVDGVPVLDYLAPILDRCSGETLPFRARRFVNRQGFYWWLTDLLVEPDRIEVTYVATDGETRKDRVETVDFATCKDLWTRWHERSRPEREPLTWYDDDRVACFTYRSFVYSAAEIERIGQIFQDIAAHDCRDLIIDLRGNGGGNSTMGEVIFSYLYDQPFTTFSAMQVRISRDVLERYADNYRGYAGEEGLVVSETAADELHDRPDAFFTGRVTLLVDNGTFSSASGFAAMFRDYGVGRIVGYETGGLPTCFGDVFSLELDHSKLPYGVSFKRFFNPRPRPGDDRHGLRPDIAVDAGMLAPCAGSDDPVLAFTLDVLRK